MSKVIEVEEKYHLFRRRGEVCRYGVYGLTWEYFKLDQTLKAPPPQVITLEVPDPTVRTMQAVITSQCNLKCTYCSFFANTPTLSSPRMSTTELEQLTRQFNEEIGEKGLLLITGGEPELYPEAINYLAEHIRGTKVLFTNGTLITPERLQDFSRRGVNVLFSLDGDLFAQDAVRRGSEGSYTKVAQALAWAKECGVNFGISAVVGDHNIERLPELVTYICQEFQPQSIGLNLPHAHGEHTWKRIEEYTQALWEIFQFAKRTGLFVDQLNRRLSPLLNQQFRFRDCAAQGEKVVVYPGGKMTSCVNEGALTGGVVPWSDRLPIFSEQCQDCFAIAICGGGCIFDGEVMYGHQRFDERNCYFTQKLLEYFLWDFRDELGEEATSVDLLTERYQALLQRSGGTYFSVGHEIE